MAANVPSGLGPATADGAWLGGVAADAVGVGPLLISFGLLTIVGTGLVAILDPRLVRLDVTAISATQATAAATSMPVEPSGALTEPR